VKRAADDERGQATVLLVAVAMFVVLGAYVLGAVGQVVADRNGDQQAADLGALAGARKMRDAYSRVFEPATVAGRANSGALTRAGYSASEPTSRPTRHRANGAGAGASASRSRGRKGRSCRLRSRSASAVPSRFGRAHPAGLRPAVRPRRHQPVQRPVRPPPGQPMQHLDVAQASTASRRPPRRRPG
jgi:hypothetical protein